MDGAFPSQQGDSFDDDDLRGQRKGFRGTVENSKTKLCLRWKNGHCRFGDRCNFAHGEAELRKLPPRNEPYSPGGGSGRGRGYGYSTGYSEGFGASMQGNRGAGGGYYDNYRGSYGGAGYPVGAGGGPAGPGGYGGPRGGPGMDDGMMNGGNDVWAARGYPVPGPNNSGWTQYRTPETGEPYYHNHRTGETTWDKPPEWGP